METVSKIREIKNKTDTALLIEYLEAAIADEMILNAFIRDIEITDSTNTTVTIACSSTHALNIVKIDYKDTIIQSIENVFEKSLEPVFILKGQKLNLENPQLINGKNISKKFKFENYVNAEFNEETLGFAKKIVEKPGKFSPLFVTSKSGLGKTHLLHALGNALLEKGLSAIYIEPNRFTKDITELSKLGGNAISEYADGIKAYDILIFDDIQNLGDRSTTLKVLFEIINSHIEDEKQIIIASDKLVKELSGFESRFITRFSSGITTIIKEPSTLDLIKVLEEKLKWENMHPEKWEKEALKFIARNNSNSIRSIEGAIKRVSFFTEDESNIHYTVKVVSNIFKELEIAPEELTPQRILHMVSSYYKIKPNELIGPSRKGELIVARHMAMWLVKKILDLPLVEIGRLFSNRDHTTILSAVKKIETQIIIDKAVKMAAEKIEQNIKSIS